MHLEELMRMSPQATQRSTPPSWTERAAKIWAVPCQVASAWPSCTAHDKCIAQALAALQVKQLKAITDLGSSATSSSEHQIKPAQAWPGAERKVDLGGRTEAVSRRTLTIQSNEAWHWEMV